MTELDWKSRRDDATRERAASIAMMRSENAPNKDVEARKSGSRARFDDKKAKELTHTSMTELDWKSRRDDATRERAAGVENEIFMLHNI